MTVGELKALLVGLDDSKQIEFIDPDDDVAIPISDVGWDNDLQCYVIRGEE